MGGLFSSKKKTENKQPNRITEQDKAVLSLKQQRDKLKQYQKKINLTLEKERQYAKQLLKDNKKDKAKLLLKKKHYQENLLKKTDGQLENIDRLISEVEFAQVELKVVEGLKQGNEALKKLHEIMSVEDVERIMDEAQEGIEYQNEIDELLSGGLTAEDEEDIMNELAELERLELPSVPDTEIPTADVDDQLPDVPSAEPATSSKTKTKEPERVAMAAT
ncbi:charged multivesicular body protein 6-A-like [Clytia hemisphaerica]|uniref:Charged multivesicular body protein 6 n=1 Tax=Clytia hemisphaerica TaxID=252671 RepID=A0A7M5X113_9CNID